MAIPFDLRLPGWLPPSHATNLTATSYGLRADIKLGWLDGPMKSSLRLLALSNPSVSSLATARSSSPFTCFKVLRHRFPVPRIVTRLYALRGVLPSDLTVTKRHRSSALYLFQIGST